MRTLEADLFNALGPLVAGRVHPVVIPQGTTFPCMSYTTVTAGREQSLCGSTGLVRNQVQVDIYALDYSEVLSLRAQVITIMKSFVLTNILALESEAFEPEVKAFRRVLQYSISQQEGA